MRKILSLLIIIGVFTIPVYAQEDATAMPEATEEVAGSPLQATSAPVMAEAEADHAVTLTDVVANNFIVLRNVVVSGGMAETLARGDYTLLAPTDGAFQTLLNDLDLSLNDLLSNKALLEGLLSYHLIEGTVTAEALLDQGQATTLSGDTISFGYDTDISRVLINNGEATIEQGNIHADNGLVQIIDNVLLPPNYMELLSNPEATGPESLTLSTMGYIDNNFVVLSAAIDAAGLREAIDSGEYTVLAPTDGAFLTLLNEMDTSEADLLANGELLTNVLKYHVIEGRVTSDALRNGETIVTLAGTSPSFGYDSDISRVTIDGGRATVAHADIYTNNGLVHVIDNVLIPAQ